LHRAATARLEAARALMKAAAASPTALAAAGIAVNRDGVRRSAFELAAQPHLTIDALASVWPELAAIEPALARRLEADAKYAVYLDRQDEDVARYRRSEALTIPADFDYASLSGLSNELKAKFIAVRPASLGQAGRVEGATPAALALIAAHARRRSGAREVGAL
jgi:tRNA uridine 5-carboxymethylaminomethyl modification enzyme